MPIYRTLLVKLKKSLYLGVTLTTFTNQKQMRDLSPPSISIFLLISIFLYRNNT